MGELYDTDILKWSEHHSELPRQHAASRTSNSAIDWPNIIKEGESVDRSQLTAVQSLPARAIDARAIYLSKQPAPYKVIDESVCPAIPFQPHRPAARRSPGRPDDYHGRQLEEVGGWMFQSRCCWTIQ